MRFRHLRQTCENLYHQRPWSHEPSRARKWSKSPSPKNNGRQRLNILSSESSSRTWIPVVCGLRLLPINHKSVDTIEETYLCGWDWSLIVLWTIALVDRRREVVDEQRPMSGSK